MKIFSFVAAAWMSFMSFLGFSRPAAPAPVATSTPPAAVSTTIPVAPPLSQIPPSSAPSGQTHLSSPSSSQPQTLADSALPATGSPWLSSLPLGDYRYTTGVAQKGYIYLCNIVQGGGGAQGSATWISGSTWYPSEKVSVEGAVAWPNASYSMTVADGTRTIVGNGLPTDHDTGIFPIQLSDPAHQFDGNPNTITAQNYHFSLPASPTMLSAPQCIYGEVGIMNDGVALFDGFDAEYRDAVAHETQDAWEAHPDESGVYHYHGFEAGYVKDPVSEVVGFAFDGYPITGAKLPDGTYLTTNQLDTCHGITSTIDLDGKSVTTYHYVLTQDFPYSVSCFRGKSYEPKPGGGAGANQQQNGQAQGGGSQSGTAPTPPAAAVSACTGDATGASCSFNAQSNTISGTCRTPPNQTSLTCIPN